MLEEFNKVKGKLSSGEQEDFHRKITSLNANIVFWKKRLTHEVATERKEAEFEIKRCEGLLVKMGKDMAKAVSKKEKNDE